VQPAALPAAPGVTSPDPVILLGSGMNGPDDLLYVEADGSVLVGEHGDGHIARITAPGVLERLPQVVPEAEGIAQVNGTTYIADQYNARIVALTDTGVRTVLQLPPVPSGENLDGISADLKFSALIVPDSPHGTVLQVDLSGNILSRVGGFSRPAGAFIDPQQGGYLIADENAGAVFELSGGTVTRIASGLPGVDDAVRERNGHVVVILPGTGRLYDATAGESIAIGLRNPQGLGFDGAQNLLVTESDNGRLDLVVRTFAVEVPPASVQLVPGQAVCLGLLRASNFTDGVAIQEAVGATFEPAPTTSDRIEVVPETCHAAQCTVTVAFRSPVGLADTPEYARFTYRD
jgi:hypothetical protein